jgi:hypothetical protein
MNATLLRVFVAIFTAAASTVWAQESKLPPCPPPAYLWDKCVGVREYSNGTYSGEFMANTRSGRGEFTFRNGDKLTGFFGGAALFKDGWVNNGLATYTYADGGKYSGEFKDGKKDGRGSLLYANGNRYGGEWKDDKRSGKGTLFLPDGSKISGDWESDQLYGQGVIILANRTRWVQEFKDGKAEGLGIFFRADGSIESSGTYRENKLALAHAVDPAHFKSSLLPGGVEATQERQKDLEQRAKEEERLKGVAAELARKEEEEKVRIAQIEERAREQERLRAAEHDAEIKLREDLEEKLRIAQQQLQQRPAPAPAQQATNAHALVIGNAAYPGSGKLENPVNDSRAMSAKLRSLGFKVTEVEDANRAKLVTALGQFSRSAASADLSVLFYSGHGVQMSGTNYILPTDINQSDLGQATIQGISLDSVVSQFLPGKTKLVFLDACRDNPLYQTTANKSFSKGLAPINAAEGTLIAYATKDGQVASDGDKGMKNSPFTVALLEHLSDPDDIAVVLRRVREKVKVATGGKQVPWDYGSLTGGALILSAIKPTGSKK